ncbi:hypothetical protein [Qipengyuania sp. JC766]|uniref:hypothetical protein n=1 Tax=Qipengyuania sp. JC766 TaxID=3232139 RepID=UPI003459977B
MIVPLVFWSFLLGAIAIGWQAGDRADRRVLVAILLVSALSAGAQSLPEGVTRIGAILVLDLALLGVVTQHALRSHRYWPLWFAGMQSVAVLLTLFALVADGEARWLCQVFAAFWALPAMLVMVLGLLADRRAHVVPQRA